MKTLDQHTLIYDNDCPMCNLYSAGFIKAGMLDENGREAYSELSKNNRLKIDFKRAKNEIALINHKENKVIYGLDSLLIIIGNSFPNLVKIAKFSPLYWLLQRLYKFVSYNRKQLIPSTEDETKEACIPDFNLKYRILYIAFVLFFSVYILAAYNQKIFPDFHHHTELKLFICTMQIIWQTAFLGHFLKNKYWDYIGNMMTVSLIGTLLLIPALLFQFSATFYFVYFAIVICIMVLEHIRRCKILKTGLIPTLSWIVFRLVFGTFLLYIVQ